MTTEDHPPELTRPMLGRIAFVLKAARTLIAYARHFTATAAERVAVPEFAFAAVIFGTYDLPVILLRMRRGMIRALALERYLLARAARGRKLRIVWQSCIVLPPENCPPPRPAPPGPARTPRAG